MPGRKWDVPPLHEAEHGQAHVVMEPVETLPGLRQLAEAVNQLVIQPQVLVADLRDLEVIGRDSLRIRRLFVGNVLGKGGDTIWHLGVGKRPVVQTLDVT